MGTKDSDRVGHMSSDQVLVGLNQLWLQLGRSGLGEPTTDPFYPAFVCIPRGRNRFFYPGFSQSAFENRIKKGF